MTDPTSPRAGDGDDSIDIDRIIRQFVVGGLAGYGRDEAHSAEPADEVVARTALLLVIDRSGSMQSIRDDMIGGLQGMLDAQAALPGRATVDIVTFDTEVELQCSMVDISEARIQLEPRGSTALHDALGDAITGFGAALDALPEIARPDVVQVIVVTDGHENASRRYSAAQVRELVERQQRDHGWEFVFLGAGQDAVLTGTRLGFDAGSSMTFTPKGEQVGGMSDALDRYVRDVRMSKKQLFLEAERRAAAEEGDRRRAEQQSEQQQGQREQTDREQGDADTAGGAR